MDGARAAPPPPHIVLRESTRAAHEAAEASPVMQRLLANELDEAGYRELLAAQWGLLSDWEARHAAWLAGTGWPYASRAAALERDLAHAGAHLGATAFRDHATGPAALREELSRPGALPRAWGELYVIEGSALGGRVIVKRLRERLPSLPHHFYAIGENADEPWRRFQAVLDRVLADPDALRAIDGGPQCIRIGQHAVEHRLEAAPRFVGIFADGVEVVGQGREPLQDDAAHV